MENISYSVITRNTSAGLSTNFKKIIANERLGVRKQGLSDRGRESAVETKYLSLQFLVSGGEKRKRHFIELQNFVDSWFNRRRNIDERQFWTIYFIPLFGRWVASSVHFFLSGTHFPLLHYISWQFSDPCCSAQDISIHPPSKLLYRCLATTDLLVGLVNQPFYANFLISCTLEGEIFDS